MTPSPQQQWLEEQLREYLGEMRLPDEAEALAAGLASAWPSSPQGLAAKEMVAALLTNNSFICINVPAAPEAIKQQGIAALLAARKAGLGT